MTDVPSLVVSEVFGPTVSGEGISLGQRCGFIRLMGCNLHCSWCDTAYTWDADRYNLREQGTRRTWSWIVNQIITMNVGMVIVSGGEPLLHQGQPGWELLLRALDGASVDVEVETNGTIIPSDVSVQWVSRFTVSPKLAHAGDSEEDRICPTALAEFRRLSEEGRAVFKFVCATPEHVAEVERITKAHDIHPDYVWIMPLGDTHYDVADHLVMITDAAVAAGFNVTTRLHIQVWGNERGH